MILNDLMIELLTVIYQIPYVQRKLYIIIVPQHITHFVVILSYFCIDHYFKRGKIYSKVQIILCAIKYMSPVKKQKLNNHWNVIKS